jgi:hypothetical protein
MVLETSKKLTVRASATTTTRKIARLRAPLKKNEGPDRSGGYHYFHHSAADRAVCVTSSHAGMWYSCIRIPRRGYLGTRYLSRGTVCNAVSTRQAVCVCTHSCSCALEISSTYILYLVLNLVHVYILNLLLLQ